MRSGGRKLVHIPPFLPTRQLPPFCPSLPPAELGACTFPSQQTGRKHQYFFSLNGYTTTSFVAFFYLQILLVLNFIDLLSLLCI